MNGRGLRKGLMGMLAVVLLTSGGYAVKTALDFQQEAEIYETAQLTFVTIVEEEEVPLAQLPTTSTPSYVVPVDETAVETEIEQAVPVPEEPVVIANPLEPGIEVDFNGLSALNSDIKAWLHIPNTTTSYPVLQGENNQTYLDTTYDGRYSVVGSIFMDYRISGDLTDQNTIIYGHNVSSGTMFGSLKSYKTENYAQQHPYFFLLTDQGYLRYEVCFATVTSATSDVYDFIFTEEDSFAAHLEMLAEESIYDMGVEVTDQDKIVTLSTCTGVTTLERFVLIGRLDTAEPVL